MEKVKEKKKNLTIIFLIMLIVMLLGYIIFLKTIEFKNKEKDEEIIENNKDKDPIEDENKEDKDEVYIYNYDKNLSESDKEIGKKFDSKYQEYKLYDINYLEKKVTDFNSLPNNEKLNLACDYYSCIGKSSISSSIKNYFSSVFKEKMDFKIEDFLCHGINDEYHCDALYNKESDTYEFNKEYGHGYSITNEVYSKLIKVEKNENKYTLTYIKIFSAIDEGPEFGCYDVYDFSDSKANKVADCLITDEESNSTEIVSKAMENVTNYDKYSKYVYTVEMIDDNMYLVGYDFIKVNND